MVARVLRLLSQELRLKGKDVVQDTVDAPSFEPVVGDHARVLELLPQRRAEVTVDSQLAAHLCLLQKLEASVESELLRAVGPEVHSVPSTSTRPAGVTRTWTVLRAGSV